jgi:hypothetical protein
MLMRIHVLKPIEEMETIEAFAIAPWATPDRPPYTGPKQSGTGMFERKGNRTPDLH